MKRYIPVLKRTKLFSGVAEEEIEAMLGCLDAKMRSYKKGEYVYREGERINSITVLVEGSLHIQTDDYWGNNSIISTVNVGEMFGEAYAAPDSGVLLNNVVALEDSTVIFFDVIRLLTVCSSACRFHSMIVRNLMFSMADRTRRLVRKLNSMSKRTTREKLLSYLSDESRRSNSPTFEIPFNRQQLADYLAVERSAMSNELSKMRSDGLIDFDKNRFTLKKGNEY